MRRRDGHHILAKFALLVIMVACLFSAGYSGGAGMPTDDAGWIAEPLAGTAWNLVALRTDNGSIAAPLPGAEPLIIFGESGTLSGSTGCNLYSASYRINGSRISIESIAITGAYPAAAKGLMQQESRYRELLVAASSYRVNGDRLVLSGPSGKDLLIFSRAEQPEAVPLLATTWRLTHYSIGGSSAVTSPVPGTNVTLVFDDDGTLSGSAGCNAYSAAYRLNETGLVVERVIATKTSCTEPAGIMEQESAYLTLLRSAAGYRIVGNTLVVIDNKGRAILFFAAEP
ncbi:MAG TPA: META domain-containing protein [Candidatus Methanoculleus thermohydrogenotrophicum]|jgi:heat shock protein HslJ|nr:META domain-containing protein [Candidatus Methanoculleus thermohydrogenotrophicum]HOB17884.1 META domain-containing protein [Candidatus Methanoculleus thermohydrogenotrophicum]HPZ38019.1 META domain-containing protein [Candidatus Methanoculleus thermohydrogenotrophicum]HQC91271.1 META domain-containing protein [Candidatus Methanoculleus thermohydrogenotrophicum]